MLDELSVFKTLGYHLQVKKGRCIVSAPVPQSQYLQLAHVMAVMRFETMADTLRYLLNLGLVEFCRINQPPTSTPNSPDES